MESVKRNPISTPDICFYAINVKAKFSVAAVVCRIAFYKPYCTDAEVKSGCVNNFFSVIQGCRNFIQILLTHIARPPQQRAFNRECKSTIIVPKFIKINAEFTFLTFALYIKRIFG